jgi:hypothetical protein
MFHAVSQVSCEWLHNDLEPLISGKVFLYLFSCTFVYRPCSITPHLHLSFCSSRASSFALTGGYNDPRTFFGVRRLATWAASMVDYETIQTFSDEDDKEDDDDTKSIKVSMLACIPWTQVWPGLPRCCTHRMVRDNQAYM